MTKRDPVRKGPPVIRAALLFALLLASLTLVVWRQSRALAMLRGLESVRQERVLEEARRASLERRVGHLESRSRVSEEAGARFGMRLPTGREIVILPLREPAPSALAASGPDSQGGDAG